ncbi:MAG: hypothetical protein EXR75_06295 [Myxococcales bacterium]|nr:hypothetical protein [Myxococcales bacterium]
MRACAPWFAFAGASALFVLTGNANASPQASATLDVGAAATGADGGVTDHAEFFVGLRGDVLFGRDGPREMGAGPFFAVGTFAFDAIEIGGGVAGLLPVHETFPLVASLGAFVRADTDAGVEPGVAARLFWGSRSYNFHGVYGMSAGVALEFHQTLGASKTSALLVAASLDLGVMTLPIVALVNLLRGPSVSAATW